MSTPIILLALALAAEPATTAQPAPAPPPAAVAPPSAAAPSSTGPVLTLDQAMQQAQEKSLDLKGAREKLNQTKELWRKVLAGYLPTLTVAGAYTRNQFDAKLSMPTGYWLRDMSMYPEGTGQGQFDRQGTNGPDFDITKGSPSGSNPPGRAATTIMMPSGMMDMTIQDLDQLAFQAKLQQGVLLPALWPMFKIADLGDELAKMSVENARRELLFGVLQLYYGCVGLKEVIGINERLLQNQLDHEKDARVRVEAGAMPKIALIRAQIDRANAEQNLQQAKMNYASMKIALGTMIDHPEDFEVEHPAEPKEPGDPESLVKQAGADRLDLQVARLNKDLAVKNREATWYKFAPNVIATAQYQATNSKGFTGEYGAWAVGVALAWTVWEGGLREIELRENASKIVEAQIALESAEKKARDDVRRAWLDLENARSNRVKAEETIKLARENQSLVTVNYQAGAATQLEVSDANTALANAEINLVAQTLSAQLAALKLAKAAGGFNPKF